MITEDSGWPWSKTSQSLLASPNNKSFKNTITRRRMIRHTRLNATESETEFSLQLILILTEFLISQNGKNIAKNTAKCFLDAVELICPDFLTRTWKLTGE
jgi:hypothetical protein